MEPHGGTRGPIKIPVFACSFRLRSMSYAETRRRGYPPQFWGEHRAEAYRAFIHGHARGNLRRRIKITYKKKEVNDERHW